jgi:hypothetical protein
MTKVLRISRLLLIQYSKSRKHVVLETGFCLQMKGGGNTYWGP